MNKCPLCNGNLVKKKVPYVVYGIKLGDFPADVCSNCKEEWFDEETARKIENEEKKQGLFGLSRDTKIGYSGNALILRIPKVIAKFMHLKKEMPVTLTPIARNKIAVELREDNKY